MRSMRALAVVLLAMAVLAPVAHGAQSRRSAPPGFFGVVPQEPVDGADLDRMQGSVETLRLPIYWFECEPRSGAYDFGALDAAVGAAAERGIRVLPFVYGTPRWLEPVHSDAPHGVAELRRWQGFLRVLVHRYGPRGTFWRGRADKLAIHRWQIWNEPNFKLFWTPRIEPAAYAKLLHASAKTIRRADPGAKIVLAGIAPVGDGLKTWVFMNRLLRVPGVRGDFDFAALHPYSATLPELSYQMEKVRAAMVAGGAGRKPLIITEFGVASQGTFPSAFVVGELGQAEFLRRAYRLLLAMRHKWHVVAAYWYTWQDEADADPHCSFCQGAGLLRLNGSAKPAWHAYRQITGQGN